MGHVWSSLQEYEKAVDSYKTALSLKYNPAVCHFSIGTAFKNARKYQQAILAYQQARVHGFPSDLCEEQVSICRKLMR